jgi:hypothetical protein
MARNETTEGFCVYPETIRVSKKNLAEKYKLDYLTAQGLVSYLLATGNAKLVDKRKSPSGKGKPTEIFEIPVEVTLHFAA